MKRARFVLVAVRTRRGALDPLARMRLVTALALAMTGRGAARFFGVALRAGRRRLGPMRRSAVTGNAVLVAAIHRDQPRLGTVAIRAERASRRSREMVRLVAVGARLAAGVCAIVRRGNGLVAARARAHGGRAIAAMRTVTIDARFLARVNRSHFAVTTTARARRPGGGMRRVTARAVGVGLHDSADERRFGTVTPDAPPRSGRDEIVRLVTRHAPVVARGFGPRGFLVTRRARL